MRRKNILRKFVDPKFKDLGYNLATRSHDQMVAREGIMAMSTQKPPYSMIITAQNPIVTPTTPTINP